MVIIRRAFGVVEFRENPGTDDGGNLILLVLVKLFEVFENVREGSIFISAGVW